MALSTMPMTSGVISEWPSGRSRSGSLTMTSMSGRPIGFCSSMHAHRWSAPRSRVSTASGKCAVYRIATPRSSTSLHTTPHDTRRASLSHRHVNWLALYARTTAAGWPGPPRMTVNAARPWVSADLQACL